MTHPTPPTITTDKPDDYTYQVYVRFAAYEQEIAALKLKCLVYSVVAMLLFIIVLVQIVLPLIPPAP